MSLEELSRLEVVTVSRKVQKLADTAAAVSVLTAEDIARSGARSVPEALRHLPGVQAAQIGPGQWALSVRGFNGRFSNKLLIQIDGRAIYTPFFAGVFWEAQNPLIEDIERIEVVRGPGASLWGSNAVNGVINIVTRSAAATPGSLVAIGSDDQGRLELAARQGFALGSGGRGRVYARSIGRSEFDDATGAGLDNAQHGWSAGFRADLVASERSRWNLQGDAYRVAAPETLSPIEAGAGLVLRMPAGFIYDGGNLLVSGSWPTAGGEARVRAYADRLSARMGSEAKGVIDTVDVDFQHRLDPSERQDLIWGFGLRYIGFELDSVSPVLNFTRTNNHETILSAFVQDEITLVPRRWKLTLGTRVETNSLAGVDWQPNLRLLWTPGDQDSLWANVSRAARTPSLGEQYGLITFGVRPLPAGQQPPGCVQAGVDCTVAIVSRTSPEQDLQSEHLTAFELGVRRQITAGSIEAVAYRHEFSDLMASRLGEFSAPAVLGFPVIGNQFVDRVNGGKASVLGLELSFELTLRQGLRLGGAYTLQNLDAEGAGGANSALAESPDEIERVIPHQMASLRASIDVAHGHDLDLMLRHVGNLGTSRFGASVAAYQAVDVHYRWRVSPALDVSLLVNNLFDDGHSEFASDFLPAPIGQSPRRAYLKGVLRF